MRPAVWAMISCSFSSLTRKVAFGSSSDTTPGNSSSSSFAIGDLVLLRTAGRSPRPKSAANLTEPPGNVNSAGTRGFPASALPVQRTDEGEQPARGVGIDAHLALEALGEQRRALVVERAAAHVDRLDARGGLGANRRVVAIADQEVILDHAAERRERQ